MISAKLIGKNKTTSTFGFNGVLEQLVEILIGYGASGTDKIFNPLDIMKSKGITATYMHFEMGVINRSKALESVVFSIFLCHEPAKEDEPEKFTLSSQGRLVAELYSLLVKFLMDKYDLEFVPNDFTGESLEVTESNRDSIFKMEIAC